MSADLRENGDELARTIDNLRSTRELVLGLVDAVTEHAIVATDAKGVIQIFSRGAESMLAYARTDAVGTSIERFYDPEQVRAALAEEKVADSDEGRLHVLVGGPTWTARRP